MSESLKFIRKKIESQSPREDLEFLPDHQSIPEKSEDKKAHVGNRYLEFLEKIYVDVLDSRLAKE